MNGPDRDHDRVPASAFATVLAGSASLLMELTVIRYVPGRVRVLGYFTNFVLLAAFLGLGVGMLAARRWRSAPLLSWLAPAGLLVIVVATELATRLRVGASAEEFLFLEYQTRAARVSLHSFLGASFALLAAGFVPLGHHVGCTLAGPRPLARYAANVAGSLLGIAIFALLGASGSPPWVWVFVSLVATSGALASATTAAWALSSLAGVAACLVAWYGGHGAIWSPYQKITTDPLRIHPTLGLVQEWRVPLLTPEARASLEKLDMTAGFTVRVNDDSYQTPVDLSDAAISRHPSLSPLRLQYDLAFSGGGAVGDVLVLGAGTGNDVAAALRKGATSVDAVEIDPEILRLGQLHPEHPYADPRVHVQLADARAYLARTDRAYDTIVYGLLDSHVLLSQMSNVRLDSYVFTSESFALARTHLKPGGLLVVSHAVGQPWFVDRMRATLADAFEGRPPLIVSETAHNPLGYVYAAGALVPPGRPIVLGTPTLTDDWPFLYLKSRSVPSEYLIAILIIVAISAVGVRAVSGGMAGGIDATFFFLGAGFLLLETRGVTALALLIGSTWRVTSAVFAGVLVMALAGAGVASLLRDPHTAYRRTRLVYAFLGAALLVTWSVSLTDLEALPVLARAVVGAVVVSLPLLASGVVFASALDRDGDTDRAIASNLLGALLGGLTEYVSMLVGFRGLVLVAALFYFAAVTSAELGLRRRRA
jgi:SAM-dependent methyltransferase